MHDMKRFLLLLLCVLLCGQALPGLAEEELTIVHVTDMHYLSPMLTDYSEHFMEVIEAADGKVTHYTPQLMQVFVEEMLVLQPDAIILSGDLTLNGATQSHKELAELLMPLQDAGIQLLALPGNHDTGAAAYQFTGEEIIPMEGTADEAFDDLYAALGYDQALSRDASSMSYIAQVSPQVWCLLVDVNANGTAGTVNEGTFAWMEEQLAKAQEAGITVIAATHQPALTHNSMFTFGYVVNNSTRLLALYEKYHVQVNLCGHLHMQHIARAGELVEIAASSLAVSPHQYGVLRVKGAQLLDYRMQPMDVAAWAARTGQTDENLLDFAAYSADFFDCTTEDSLQAMLAELPITQAEKEQMAAFALRLNAEYFAGVLTCTAEDPAWLLWETHAPGGFFTYYMRTILKESPQELDRYVFSTAQ